MSATSSAPLEPARQRHSIRLIAAASLGNALELFDFTVFSFFAGIIGTLFFPSSTPYGSLLMAVGVFGVGFVMRPLGSMVLGAYADIKGRRSAMLVTILLMGLGTALIALTPTHAQIGIAAPLLLLVGRLLQGFSAGGEIGAATALLMESASPGKRGRYLSWQVATQGISSLIGSACGVLVTSTLSHDALYAWGWRLPFLLGLLIIPVGLYIRRSVEETFDTRHDAQDAARAAAETGRHNPVYGFLRHHLGQFVLGLGIILSATVLTYVVVFFMPTYMMQVTSLSPTLTYSMSVLVSIILTVSGIVSGIFIDRFPRYKPIAIISLMVALVLAYPTFSLIATPAWLWLALLLRLIMVAALGFNMTAGLMLITVALPRPIRATGMGLTYAGGVALFGGSAQFIVTSLIASTGSFMAPAWYLIGALVISLGAFLTFKERHYD